MILLTHSQAWFKSVQPVFSYEPESCFYFTVKEQNGLISKHRQLWKFAFLFWHLIAGQEKHTHPLKCVPFLLHTHKNKVKRTVFTRPMKLSSVSHNIINHQVQLVYGDISLPSSRLRKIKETGALRGDVYDKYFSSFTELRHVFLRQNDRANLESCPCEDQPQRHRLCTRVRRGRTACSHAQHTNTHWPTFSSTHPGR